MVAVLGLALAGFAAAADPFTSAVQAAYPPYRAALFLTNGKNTAEAAAAVAQARQAWAELAQRFAGGAPVPYQADAGLTATLAQVGSVYDKAAGQVQAGQLAQAHATLEEVRDLLAELRQRNGVVVYSDHMNAYHEQMEQVLDDGPRLLADEAGVRELLARVGALDYLAGRLRSQAPAALRDDAGFQALLGPVQAATGALKQALLRQDSAAAREALGKLKAPYSKLFRAHG